MEEALKYSAEELEREIPCRIYLPARQTTILVDLMDLPAEAMTLDVIAHSLATKARFNGHTPFPYSVAVHSVLVSTLVTRDLEWEALMHDASEAYVGDVINPIKRNLTDFKAVERAVDVQVRRFYALPLEESPAVKVADVKALWLEQHLLQGRPLDLPAKMQLTADDVNMSHCILGRPFSWEAAMEAFLYHAGNVQSAN